MDECQSCTDVRGFGYYSVEDLEDWNISGETVGGIGCEASYISTKLNRK